MILQWYTCWGTYEHVPQDIYFNGTFSRPFFQTCLRHKNDKMANDGGAPVGGILENILLGLYKYFYFSEAKHQNALISLVFNENRFHKWKENNILS